MRSHLWRSALTLLLAGSPSALLAADPANGACQGCLPCPLTCPAPQPGMPYDGSQGQTPQNSIGQDALPSATPPMLSAPPAALDDFSDLGGLSKSNGSTSIIAFGGLGISAATATGGAGQGTALITTSLLSPGLITASTVQPTLPVDRIFGGYSYYDAFQVSTLAQNALPSSTRQAGFNLHSYSIGVEKTFFRGCASAFIQAPFLNATDNVTQQDINGIGNLSVGFKALIFSSDDNRSALSAGLTVATPTAKSAQYVTQQSYDFNGPNAVGPVRLDSSITVDPTIIQPWVSGVVSFERLSIQNYLGVLIPTDDRLVTSLNENLSVNYRIWECDQGLITSITPFVNAQALIPLQDSGSPTPIGFSDQVFLTEGLQLGIGQRLSVFGGVVQPVAGPKAFDVGATGGFNFFF